MGFPGGGAEDGDAGGSSESGVWRGGDLQLDGAGVAGGADGLEGYTRRKVFGGEGDGGGKAVFPTDGDRDNSRTAPGDIDVRGLRFEGDVGLFADREEGLVEAGESRAFAAAAADTDGSPSVLVVAFDENESSGARLAGGAEEKGRFILAGGDGDRIGGDADGEAGEREGDGIVMAVEALRRDLPRRFAAGIDVGAFV